MACDYFLMNGCRGNSKALNLLVDGKLVRNFPDIANIDLQTLDIPLEESKNILSEYNPNTNLNGMFYNASYPHKDHETKTYSAIFDYGDKTKYYSDNLKYFAEQREYKKSHKQKVELDNNTQFDNYVRNIMYKVLTSNNDDILRYDSLISRKMKSIISEKRHEYSETNTEFFINIRISTLKKLLSGYTELRNLTYEYMSMIEKTNSCTRTKLDYARYWSNNGMIPKVPQIYTKKEDIKPEIEYTQPTIFDFCNVDCKENVKIKK